MTQQKTPKLKRNMLYIKIMKLMAKNKEASLKNFFKLINQQHIEVKQEYVDNLNEKEKLMNELLEDGATLLSFYLAADLEKLYIEFFGREILEKTPDKTKLRIINKKDEVAKRFEEMLDVTLEEFDKIIIPKLIEEKKTDIEENTQPEEEKE